MVSGTRPGSNDPEGREAGKVSPPTFDAPHADAERPDVECHWIGPIADEARAKALSEELVEEGHRAILTRRARTEKKGVKVLSATQPTRADAVALVARLEEAGISDLFLPPGQGVRQVSLGAFVDLRSAERRLRELGAKGFDVELSPWQRRTTSYYLAARLPGDAPPPRLLSGEGLRGERLELQEADGTSREVDCEDIVAR